MREIDIARLGPAAQKQIMQKLQAQKQPRSKYGNQKTETAGITFDSKKEARRFEELRQLESIGAISDLRLQVDFTLQEAYTDTAGQRVRAIRYKADFTYYIEDRLIVEDVKSEATRKNRVYTIKKKMMAERYGISIQEI